MKKYMSLFLLTFLIGTAAIAQRGIAQESPKKQEAKEAIEWRKDLNLSKEQAKEARQVRGKYRTLYRELNVDKHESDQAEYKRLKMNERKELLALLTPEQRQKAIASSKHQKLHRVAPKEVSHDTK